MWEQVVKNLSAFFSMPVVRNFLTAAYVVVGILLVLSKTSIGRKALLSFKTQYDNMKREHNEIVEQKNRQIDAIKLEFAEREKELKQDLENKVAVITYKTNAFAEKVCELLNEFPNIKIQEKIAEIKKEFDTSLIGISDLIDFEVKKAQNSANLIITDLEQRIKALEDKYLKESDTNGKEE